MGRTARIALLQLPAFSIEDAAASLEHTLRRIDDAARERPDLIALPEVTYPAYFVGTDDLTRLTPSLAEATERIAAKAREHGTYVAAGMALDAPGGGYTNSAALFGRDGALIGSYAKSLLWHFDSRWFKAGNEFPVFDTDFGRVGMLICADARLPEIARSLVLNGAQLLLDLTAWVSSGRHAEDLTTLQREYLLQTRAAENGIWIAAAGKSGVEAQSIVYCGRSCVITPRGEYAAALGSENDALLVHDIPIEDASPPVTRRPELYSVLAEPTASLPVVRAMHEPFVMQENERRIAVVQTALPPTGEEFLAAARVHVERLALQDAAVIVFPATPSRSRPSYDHDATVAGMTDIARATGVCVAFTVSEGREGSGRRAIHLVGPRGIIGTGYQTHKPPGPRFESMPLGDEPCPIFDTPVGRVGLMLAADGSVPEVARSMMLRGAEFILWCADAPGLPMRLTARARAEENRVFLACAAAPTANGATMVVSPAGGVLAEALEGRELAVAATVNRALSHLKERAPGTDVVRDRQPEAYGAIVARQPVGSVI